MFDIGWPEFAVIIVVALLFLGPKELPRALYTVGKWVKAARKMTGEFQRHVDDMIRETELEEIRKGLNKRIDIGAEIEKTVDPKGDLKKSMSMKPGQTSVPAPAKPQQPSPAKAASDTAASPPAPTIAPAGPEAATPVPVPAPVPAKAPDPAPVPASADRPSD